MSQSTQDREALQEIARLIAENNGAGAGGEQRSRGDKTSEHASDPNAAPCDGASPNDDGTSEALDAALLGRLLECIPAAIAIFAHGQLVRANEAFALAFGFNSVPEVKEAGGLVRIFSGVTSELFSPEGTGAPDSAGQTVSSRNLTLEARTKSGRKISMPLVVHYAPAPSDVGLLVLHPREGIESQATRTPEDAEAQPEAASPAVAASQQPPPEVISLEQPPPEAAVVSSDADVIDLLAKVSHEVRTPLNSIIGFAELMEQEQFGPLGHAKYEGYARDIAESGRYALGIINDLLDLSKIQSGNFELNFTAVDANEVIEDCVHLIEPQALQARVVLRVALDKPMPPVLADRRSLKQILLNLLSNAVKFTQSGGQVIVSSSHERDGAVLLRVRDTGVGMSKSDIAQAMKPFQQLDTAPRQQMGTGIGLPLTRALVEANRAEMRLESARSIGTSIDISFPPERVLKT